MEPPERAQVGLCGLEPVGRVVVATDGDDREVREVPPDVHQKLGQHGDGGRGRVGDVEEVAGDEQAVGALALAEVGEPGEKGALLGTLVHVVERVTEVPVGGVDETKRHGSD